jgi:ribosomal protein S18 acetylase RimI-like enzyme
VNVRAATTADAPYLRRSLTSAFGSPLVAVHGELIDTAELPAAVARQRGELVGHLAWRPEPGGNWEIVSIVADRSGGGIGSALLDWIRAEAQRAGVTRLWLVTTNDNTKALRLYQRHGFDLVALHRNAVTRARALKPQIPLESDGIPLRHELELELRLPQR